MIALEFRTVPDELLGIASAAMDLLKSRGYTVTPERRETGYPFAPTLHGKRGSETGFVEVEAKIAVDRMRQWVAYGRSCKADTRVWCALPEDAKRSGKEDRQLKELGVGLILVGDGEATETMPPKDLALGFELPDITTLPRRFRKKLGPVYEHFDRAEWREGFEEACLALEDAARKYLWKEVKAGRIAIVSRKGKQQQLTKKTIDKFSMGDLAGRFPLIVQQSHADRVIGDVLKQVNPSRVGVAHHKRKAAAETKLREEVGGQMWLIFGALREIDGSP